MHPFWTIKSSNIANIEKEKLQAEASIAESEAEAERARTDAIAAALNKADNMSDASSPSLDNPFVEKGTAFAALIEAGRLQRSGGGFNRHVYDYYSGDHHQASESEALGSSTIIFDLVSLGSYRMVSGFFKLSTTRLTGRFGVGTLKNVSGSIDDAVRLARNQPYGSNTNIWQRVPIGAQDELAMMGAKFGLGVQTKVVIHVSI